MQHWKGRLRASGIHLGISLCIAFLAGLLVFGLWYPYPYREISGGRALFLLMTAVDVVMGPLITLVVFNQTKRHKELVLDLTVVAVLQLAALGYGIWTVFIARPVHLVFEYTRMSVVHAVEVDATLLAQAPVALRSLPVHGPTPIALRPFKDAAEQFDATMSAIGGIPLAARSDLWQEYDYRRADILREAKPASELLMRFASQAALVNTTIERAGRPVDQLRYLPLVSRDKVWTVLLDATTAQPLAFMPIDSY